jgi:hypothetical protein
LCPDTGTSGTTIKQQVLEALTDIAARQFFDAFGVLLLGL